MMSQSDFCVDVYDTGLAKITIRLTRRDGKIGEAENLQTQQSCANLNRVLVLFQSEIIVQLLTPVQWFPIGCSCSDVTTAQGTPAVQDWGRCPHLRG
jgi:hypothetical protein